MAIPFGQNTPLKKSQDNVVINNENSHEERSVGWANIMDILDNRFENMEYLKDPCIAMSWRVDTGKVPETALKQECRKAEDKIKEFEKLEYLPKERRREIKEAMRLKLLKRAIPSTRTYDMIWNLRTGIVLFGSLNNKLCDRDQVQALLHDVMRTQTVDNPPLESHLARPRASQPLGRLYSCTLARTIGTQESSNFSFSDFKGNIPQGL
ncbi:MAG TPA: hypothetical protein EYP19_14015 [Desulfobacterales bacterium]|nr:hypothetical protein [Desulfobacterales bacterium]